MTRNVAGRISIRLFVSAVLMLAAASLAGAADVPKMYPPAKVVKDQTDMMRKAADGNVKAVKAMLDAGADPNVCDEGGVTVLMSAKDAATLKALLEFGVNPNICHPWHKETLLHWLADHDSSTRDKQELEKAEILLTHGANPNFQEAHGETPLHKAVQHNRMDLIELFLEKGADPNVIAKYSSGMSPTGEAAAYQKMEIYLLLKAKGGKLPPGKDEPNLGLLLRKANSVADMKDLIAKGADVNVRDKEYGRTPLWFFSDPERVDFLLSKGADINAADKEGMTMLHVDARRWDNDDRVLFLLARGAKIEAQDNAGLTALHHSISSHDACSVQLLLSKGASPKAVSKSGKTPLHLAVQTEHVDIVRVLLKAGSDPNAADADGMTSLHVAAQSGVRKVIQALIAGGANVNAKTVAGETPLHFAAKRGRIDIIKVLLSSGADPRTTAKDGRPPLYWASTDYVARFLKEHGAVVTVDKNPATGKGTFLEAASKGDAATIKDLLAAQQDLLESTDDAGKTALYLAAAGGHRDSVGLLILRGANVSAAANDGSTPLHAAAAGGHKDVIKNLLIRRPDLGAKDKAGSTPLHLAAAAGHAEVVELLLAKGADAAVKDEKGRTALDVAKTPEVAAALKKGTGATEPAPDAPTAQQVLKAAEGGDVAGLKKMLESAPKLLECRDDSGRSPLYVAASAGKAEAVGFLIGLGGDVNAAQKTKSTPLHAVAARGHDGVAALLLEKKAGVNAQNDLGITPLHYAAAYGHEKLVELLLKSGADPTAKDKEGKTALDYARKQGHKPVMQLLEANQLKGG